MNKYNTLLGRLLNIWFEIPIWSVGWRVQNQEATFENV